ncbi:MAG: hypothetical protein WCP11_02800 [Candidatus Saccharibacteria bacterium]
MAELENLIWYLRCSARARLKHTFRALSLSHKTKAKKGLKILSIAIGGQRLERKIHHIFN